MPKIAVEDREIENCFDVLLELRPELLRSSFLELIREMDLEGCKLVYIEEKGHVVAAAGYRITTNLFMGKSLYVDDLVTLESVRSKGYGNISVTWLHELAVKNGCNVLHLDSGAHRHQAHKFYYRNGFTIASFHFSESVT